MPVLPGLVRLTEPSLCTAPSKASHACFGLCFDLHSLVQSGDCVSFTFAFKFIEYLVHSFAPFYRLSFSRNDKILLLEIVP